jgi:hypothetical protein
MAVERWGALSVKDHIDPNELTANVLLYDRLVLPVVAEHSERDERDDWAKAGWEPDLQDSRLEQLDELAVQKPWDEHRRELFKAKSKELK